MTLGTLTARTVQNNFKGTIEKFVRVAMSTVKGTPGYWKQFLYMLAMIEQLEHIS